MDDCHSQSSQTLLTVVKVTSFPQLDQKMQPKQCNPLDIDKCLPLVVSTVIDVAQGVEVGHGWHNMKVGRESAGGYKAFFPPTTKINWHG